MIDVPTKTLGELLAESVHGELSVSQSCVIQAWLDSHDIADCVPLAIETIHVKVRGYAPAELMVVGKVEDTRAEVDGSYIDGYIDLGDQDHTRVPLRPGQIVAIVKEKKSKTESLRDEAIAEIRKRVEAQREESDAADSSTDVAG